MRFIDWAEHARRYLHVEALLKHVAPIQMRQEAGKTFSAISTQKLIEYVSRSQADKWRRYATSENGGPDRSLRLNAS